MPIPTEDVQLVERFHRNLDVYKRDGYKEARVRVEFIDPFFEALGWDVRNVQGYSEQYKDVVQEESLRVGGDARAPVYCVCAARDARFAATPLRQVGSPGEADVGVAAQARRCVHPC